MNDSVASNGTAAGTGLVVWEPVVSSDGAFGSAPVIDAVPRPVNPAKPARLTGALRIGKAALMIWGAVSLTAAGAYAVGQAFSADPVLKAETAPAAKPAEPEIAVAPAAVPSKPAKVAAISAGSTDGVKKTSAAPKPAVARKAEAAPRKVETTPAPAKIERVDEPRSAAAAPDRPETEAPRRLLPLTNADDAEIQAVRPDRIMDGEPEVSAPDSDAEQLAGARMPRPRPDAPAPIVTGSIDREWEDMRRQRRWDRRFEAWREREFRRIRRLPRYIIVR